MAAIELESVPEIDNKFAASGGQVYDYYDDDNRRPKTWLCGRGPNGEPIDPPSVNPKDAIHRLNSVGRYEGANPTADVIDEMKMWRSDWTDPDAAPRYGQADYGRKTPAE